MFRSCFESLASVVPIKLVRAAHCGVPRRALRCATLLIAVRHATHCGAPRRALRCATPRIAVRHAAHCGTPYVHGQLWEKNDWQFSNPRIDTASFPLSLHLPIPSSNHKSLPLSLPPPIEGFSTDVSFLSLSLCLSAQAVSFSMNIFIGLILASFLNSF